MIATDIFLVPLSLWLAFALRLSEWFWPSESQLWLFILGPILALPIFIKLGLYRAVIRYIGYRAMLAVVQAITALVLIWLVIAITILPLYIGVEKLWFPRSIPILFWMTLLLTVGGSRQGIRWLLSSKSTTKTTLRPQKNVLIYGAGRAGLELATSLAHNENIRLLGFIDDDRTLHDHYVQNLKVLGDRTVIEKIRATTNHLEVLLATPNTNNEGRKELLKYLETKRVIVRTIPSLGDIASRAVTRDDLRDVDISDLLARKAVMPNQKLLSTCITNKKILVTGAGGSIGSELCRQILALNPVLIVLFEHSELNLYKINTELVSQCISTDCKVKIIPLGGFYH